MKKIIVVWIVCLVPLLIPAEETYKIDQWRVSVQGPAPAPVFSDQPGINGETFDPAARLQGVSLNPLTGTRQWQAVTPDSDGVATFPVGPDRLAVVKTQLKVNRWIEGKLHLKVNGLVTVFLDGNEIKSRAGTDFEPVHIDLKTDRGNHELLLKVITAGEKLQVHGSVTVKSEYADCGLTTVADARRFLTIHDILEGTRLDSASLSPSGRYVLIRGSQVFPGGKSLDWVRIHDLRSGRDRARFRSEKVPGMRWLPRSDHLSYTLDVEGATSIYLYDLETGREKEVARGLKDFSDYTWSPTGDFIIYSEYRTPKEDLALKRVYEVDDRLPYYRNRSFLYKIELESGQILQLTAGHRSAYLHDIRPDGKKILFSTSRDDYSEVPFSRQNLYQLDLATGKPETLWEDKLYDGYCQYSPDGRQLLVQGGPECFGEAGVNVSEGRIPNSYDGQLYLFEPGTGKAKALTRDFDPAVNSAHWHSDGNIYLTVTERDYQNLYRLRPDTGKLVQIEVAVEVIDRIDYARDVSRAVYSGTSIHSPAKLYALDLKKGHSRLLFFPQQKRFENILSGNSRIWNFVNRKGTTIHGRVYYPPGFDKEKKYPVIVNFYGGTSPIERSFGGRYPINIWAAQGYVVYVLQPSGATGFGQDFSALHVNGWGFDAIDDIIEGTEKFLKEHPQADAANVGCIGASYGGYTAMLIQTRTKLFKTAIAHAGISSITSYWGEGYWGYSYNTGAARGSYPWNRKDIYVENSPIYNADKFNNSILLLHGSADTNVPVGESWQYYAALKLLGKEVEMVLVDQQNHWILDYDKRIKWHHTIMSWFDKKLKDQPQHWEDMYPEKNF